VEPDSSLFRETAKGVFWSGGGQVLAQTVHLLVRLVLARLLAPEDFGLVAMAMVVIGFTDWLRDLGIGAALVQRKELTEAHRSTGFWASVLMGLLVLLSLVLLAPLISRFFGSDQLTPVLIALSFGVVLSAPTSVLQHLLMRDLDFQVVASRQVLSVLVAGAVGLALALTGFGVWALVGQTLAKWFFGAAFLFWKSPWRPKFIFQPKAFSDLWSYSRPLVGGRLLNYFNRNLDTVLIGRYLDARSLGYYNVGYQLVLLPLAYVTRPVASVLFTTLSKLQDEPIRLRNAYLQALQSVAFVTFPLMIGLALAGPTLIPQVLGEKWRPAASLIPFLCLVGFVQSVLNLAPAVFQAMGRTPLVLRWTLAGLIGNAVAFALGLRWGVLGVAVAYLVSTLALTPFLMHSLLRLLGMRWSLLLRAFWAAAILTSVMTLVWFLTGWVMLAMGVSADALIATLIRILTSAAMYFLTSWRWNPIVKDYYRRLEIGSKISQWTRREHGVNRQ
jgi:O-antigen/teichoic acid export membrane protein